MRLRFGPITLWSTPRMRAVKDSTRVPSKTVRPTPSIPGVTSRSDMNGSTACSGQMARTAKRSATSARRKDIVQPARTVGRSEEGAGRALPAIILNFSAGWAGRSRVSRE